jgi:magnesium chelatase family protein
MGRQGCLNARLDGAELTRYVQLTDHARRLLSQAVARQDWSARAVQRALRVAKTLADMADSPRVNVPHVAQAIQFRALNHG